MPFNYRKIADRRRMVQPIRMFRSTLTLPIVLIALHTGMRRGEICNLQWFDLNFDRGLIHVRNTKNGKDRIIPMNATVRQLLEAQKVLRARKAQENAEKGKSKVPSPDVFPSP